LDTRRNKTLKIINKFLETITKEMNIEKVMLFGSNVKKKNTRWSDIDLAIVSDDFKYIDCFDRLVKLGKVAWDSHTTVIEPIGFTKEEFADDSPWNFVSEIKKTGEIIYQKK